MQIHPDKLVLRTFGGLSLDNGGRPLLGAAVQRGRLAILAVLAVAGSRGISRDKLLALFWPESDEERARGSLKQALYALRRDVGERELTLGTTELRLNPDVISSDVGEFEAALQRGDQAGAVGLYAGPFLDSVLLKGLADFEEWSDYTRVRLRQAFRTALETLASEASARGDHVAASRWWQRSAAEDRLSERVARSYMKALVDAGERERAIQHGEAFVKLVRAELDSTPGDGFTSYHSGLANGRNHGHLTIPLLASTAVTTPHGSAEDTEAGRRAEPAAVMEISPAFDHGLDHTGNASFPGMPSATRGPPGVALPRQANPGPGAAKRRVVVAALGIALVAVALVTVYTPARGPASSSASIVLVAPFENAAGDTSFNSIGRAAEAMLTEGLQRTGIVGVVDASTVMAAPSPTDREGARQAALAGIMARTDASIIVAGQVFRAGADSLELRSRIVDARSGRVLNVLNPIRLRPDAPDSALLELRDRVNGALAALIDTRLASLREEGAPPPRFAAYQEFVEGIDFFAGKRSARFDYSGSILHFTRAAQLDTMWNLPLSWLAFAYGNVGNERLRDSVVDVLGRRRDRLAPLDRYALDYFLSRRVNDDEGSYRAVVRAAKLAPASNWTYMHGLWATNTQRDDEAIAAFRTLDADGGWIQSWIVFRITYARVLHLRGRFDEELRVAREGVRHNPDPNIYHVLFGALGSRGDVRALDELVDSIALLPNAVLLNSRTGIALAQAASEASVHGYPEVATHVARRCVEWIQGHPPNGKGPPLRPIERQVALEALGQCLVMLERWDEALTRSFEEAQDEGEFGALARIRLVLIALRQRDSVTANRRIAEAYTRPQFYPDSNYRGMLDALVAASAGDARGTAHHLGLIRALGAMGRRTFWHARVEITPELRRSRELRPLIESR